MSCFVGQIRLYLPNFKDLLKPRLLSLCPDNKTLKLTGKHPGDRLQAWNVPQYVCVECFLFLLLHWFRWRLTQTNLSWDSFSFLWTSCNFYSCVQAAVVVAHVKAPVVFFSFLAYSLSALSDCSVCSLKAAFIISFVFLYYRYVDEDHATFLTRTKWSRSCSCMSVLLCVLETAVF